MTFKSPVKLAILIGPDGRRFDKNSPELVAYLGDSNPDYDSTLFAVQNLGFIEFVHHDSLSVEITVHPRNVEHSTLCGVQNLLSSLSQTKLFIIKYFDRSWKSEMVRSARDAAVRMFQLCAGSDDFAPLPSEWLVASRSERRETDRAIADWQASVCGHGDNAEVAALDLTVMLPENSSYRFVLAISPVTEDTALLSYGTEFAKLLDLPPSMVAGLAMTKLIPKRFSEAFLRGCNAAIEQNAPARVEGEVARDDGWRELFRAAFIPVGGKMNAGGRLVFGAFNCRRCRAQPG